MKDDIVINLSSLPEGFYYNQDDYAGLMKRFIIIVIDFIVIYLISTFILIVFVGFGVPFDESNNFIYLIILVVSYFYLTMMKRSWGTVGYWITGVQIVDLEGEEPSMWLMTLRYFLLLLGPINIILDIIWLTNDENRQTLRDKIAETYVIKRNAVPLGYGKQKLSPYFIMGYSFTFKEVERTPGS